MGSNVYKNTLVRMEFTQATPATTWTITHGIGTLYPVVDCYILNGSAYSRFWPEHVNVINSNTVELVFGVAQQGYATVM